MQENSVDLPEASADNGAWYPVLVLTWAAQRYVLIALPSTGKGQLRLGCCPLCRFRNSGPTPALSLWSR